MPWRICERHAAVPISVVGAASGVLVRCWQLKIDKQVVISGGEANSANTPGLIRKISHDKTGHLFFFMNCQHYGSIALVHDVL